MNDEEKEIREEYRRRRPKGSLYRGGPTQRNPEDIVVEMVLEERRVFTTIAIGAHKERQRLLARIAELEAQLEEAQLRSIEARNPGIDLDEVRRIRNGEEPA